MLGCGIALMQAGTLFMQKLIYKRFPVEYLTPFMRPDGNFMTSFMHRVARADKPKLYEPSADATSPQLQRFRKYDLRNVAAQGLYDPITGLTSYFSFFQIPPPLTEKHAYTLNLLVPSMHAAMVRICKQAAEGVKRDKLKTSAPFSLSRREKEVMRWVMKGKTSWEIAQILGSSKHTVRNQIRSVLAKLNVSTRAEAVALLKDLPTTALFE